MTDIKSLASMPAYLLFLYAILLGSIFSGCIEPNTEDLWSITGEGVLQTEGFARDIAIDGNIGYVAAGQSGIQIWNLDDQMLKSDFQNYMKPGATDLTDFEDLSLIDLDTMNKLIFASESNQNVGVFSYDREDTLIYYNDILSIKTKDFVAFPSDSGVFIIYAADNDDGMKWSIFEYDPNYDYFGNPGYRPTFPEISDAEIETPGKPQGIDSDGSNYVVMAVDQLGVELYSIDSLGAVPIIIGSVNTEGNAEKVTLTSQGVYVACDDAGAYFITIGKFSGAGSSTRFAEDLTVDHIAVYNGIAALSLGAKGIALYDVTDPSLPIEKGIFPVGYTYKSQFWGEKLVVCSREGLQILTIEK
jgi:hypothetical protein